MPNMKSPSNREGQIYNPYSFVPLSEYVFNYTEKEKTQFLFANDIPFKDGISGKILVEFKAETPFCVKSQNKENCNINRRFFIPSTSIKGMVRSVFDIITLSNIRNLSENSRFSMRDLRSNDYEIKNDKPHSGFLILFNGKYYIIPCDHWQMTYEDIRKEERVNIKNAKSAEDKYRMLEKGYIFTTEDDRIHYWVFSGFMNNKKHEYDFALPNSINLQKFIPIEDKELKDFLFIHEKENENKTWSFWKKEMRNFTCIEDLRKAKYKGLAPCFYRTKEEKEKICVKDLGFTFLYRMPYQKKVHDCLPIKHTKETFDMSQALFGYTQTDRKNKSGESLRGRVRFSNAFIENAEREGEHTFILGSPKPTFYPFYLRQNGDRKITFAAERPIISGWKRHLVHKYAQTGKKQERGCESSFIALKAGASFKTIIYIHNLRPYELGALLAALTFCNHKECYHSLGYAKPFGYGKMKLTDIKLTLENNDNNGHTLKLDSLINDFRRKIAENTLISVNEYDKYIEPLIRIAAGKYKERIIRYPELKEFKDLKSQKQHLHRIKLV
jgi:CRISPR-associated protein